ncbi:MAG: Gfo/Idh/MocA family oxidoreductase [Gemmataceae bacterium]|nr:Gfo/Idh/MocA family oxidoreductase [Gemmataceae bacterium]
MTLHMERRRFLKVSAGLAATGYFAGVAPAQEQVQPADRIRVAIVGVNGQGTWNLNEVEKSGLAEIVALCDVDVPRSDGVRKRFPKAAFFEDYRQMLEKQKDIQAVLIATPDHHHAIPAVLAMRAGKHVYCEKPLAHSVHEVRAMMEAAARNKVVTQMGTQIHAGDNYRRVVEIVQSGALGPVRRVHVWCERRPDAMHLAENRDQKPPQGLNYDLWLGPAPLRSFPPYRLSARGVHFDWRWWWDYGGGVLADMACHFMDLPHWALNLRHPTTVAAQGRVTYKGDNEMPDLLQVEYEYPARGNAPPVHLTWYHGQRGPDLEGKVTYNGFTSGVLFEGEKGNLVANYGAYRLLPEDRFKDFTPPKPTIARSIGHHREWLTAIQSGGATTCNFDYSGALSETVLLGNVAYRAGNIKFQYDAKTGRIANNRDAERWLRREYRKGWTL